MKKIIAVIIVICLLASTASASVVFQDVNRESAGGKAIYKLVEKGIIEGYGNGLFGPYDSLTRAQAVKIINKVFSYTVPAEISFTDVPADAWYYNEVAIAFGAGYIKGYGNGLFGPDDYLTREQVCVMINNIMQFESVGTDVYINDAVSFWAQDSVKKVVGNGFASVEANGNFRATQIITREETCVILSQFIIDTPPSVGGSVTSGNTGNAGNDNRAEIRGKLLRVSSGIRTDLIPKTNVQTIKNLFEFIAVNMENYANDPNYDYQSGVKKAKADYSRMRKEYRDEARSLLVEFFLDEKYTDDIDELYEFFF